MCGFVFTTVPDVIEDLILPIAHRGLTGRFKTRQLGLTAALGHVRLPIQGLSEEFDQPYEYGEWVFAFVGEIFNFRELMPSAKSDIEVLARFWNEMGPACMKRFDGFWSIAAYHKPSSTICIATDFLAKKPIYCHPDTFSFASEIKALTPLIPISKRAIDKRYMAGVAKWGYHIGERTFVEGITKIPPGTLITINLHTGGVTTNVWSNLLPRKVDIRSALEKAVDRRLISDVGISLLVSGGFDSSLIYKLVERRTHDIVLYHIENHESEFLNYLDIPSDIPVVKIGIEDITTEELRDVLYANEGPVDLGSMLSQYAITLTINERPDSPPVILTGDGADELFGGYRRQKEYDAQYSDIFEELVYYHLPRLDKMSMFFTKELRCPFLAKDVIEGALSWPYQERINKNGLKMLFHDIVPPEICNREKKALKSDPVLNDPYWRHKLIRIFEEEVFNEYP